MRCTGRVQRAVARAILAGAEYVTPELVGACREALYVIARHDQACMTTGPRRRGHPPRFYPTRHTTWWAKDILDFTPRNGTRRRAHP